MTRTLFITTALVSTLLAGTVLAQGKGQGVTKTEIILGSHTDLSGPAAIWGTSVRNGMQMRFDEVNALGGIHGRKIKFIVEDNAYTIPKAVAATDKLIKKDKVLAMVANLGSPMNMATIPTAMKAGVPNLFPFSAAEGMYEPFEKMKFAFAVAYGDQMRGAVNYFTKVRGKKKICSMYQDDDFGQDVVRGADIQLKELGMSQTERTTFKRGDKDFSSQIAKLRQAGCEVVILGTIISESIGAAAEAKKIGWATDMVVSSAGYTPQVAELAPQGVTEGLYGAGQSPIIYPDTAPPEAKIWMDRYKAKFNRDSDLQSQAGYAVADMVVFGLDQAGKDLNTETLVKGLEKISNLRDIFGSAPQTFGANRRLGADPKTAVSLYQIKAKRWVYVDRVSF